MVSIFRKGLKTSPKQTYWMKQNTGSDFFKNRDTWLNMGVAERILRASDMKVISYFVHYYGPYDSKNEEVNLAERWMVLEVDLV